MCCYSLRSLASLSEDMFSRQRYLAHVAGVLCTAGAARGVSALCREAARCTLRVGCTHAVPCQGNTW